VRSRIATVVVFALVLLLPTLAAAKDLTVWHSYRGAEEKALVQLVEQWNEQHGGLQVRLVAVPYEAYANKITSAVPRGQGPDLFIFAHERTGDWARSGIIEPVGGMMADRLTDKFIPSTKDALRWDGELYGMPLAFKSVALFYNRELVDEPPKDTDTLLEIAERHTSNEADRYGLSYQATSFYHHSGWLFGFGGSIFDESGIPRLDTPENARSLAFVRDLQDRRVMPREQTGALVAQLFNESRAAMVINGPWFLGEIEDQVDFGVAPLPLVSATGKPATPFLTVEAAFLPQNSSQPKAALEFARFLATGDGARTRLEVGKQLVADQTVYDDPGFDLDPTLQQFREQAEQARPMPNRPAMRAVWEPAALALRSVLRGDLGPEASLEKAQRRLEVVTRPPPEPRDPTFYVVSLIVIALALLGWLAWSIRRRGGLSALAKAKTAYAYLAPGAIALIALIFIPFAVGTAVAFFSHDAGEFQFVGLANFESIITSRDYPVTDPLSFYFTLAVTVMWTALNVALHVTIGLALAMLLRYPWLKLKGVYRVLLIVPWAVPSYITALIWKGMFHSQFGAINGLLEALGLQAIPWFSGFWTAFAANVTTNTWLGFPFMMVVCLGALQAIPKDLEEAAMMDGAGAWTRFHRVILPLIKPALVPAVVLGSVWTFNMFNIVYLVSGGEPDGSTEILISEAYKWAFSRQEQYGYAAAYATLIFFALVGYSAFTKQITQGDDEP
jgi:arabinogalactan oligomer/maltooligosaccharide transport system permease protein